MIETPRSVRQLVHQLVLQLVHQRVRQLVPLMDRPARRTLRNGLHGAIAVAIITGCTSTSPSPEERVAAIDAVDRRTFESSDFCRRMLDLERSEPSLDRVIRTYRDLVAIAPEEIAADLAAVLADLTGDTPITTPTPEDPVAPDDPDRPDGLEDLDDRVPPPTPDPAQAVAAYIDEFCRSTALSPLPGPTAPD